MNQQAEGDFGTELPTAPDAEMALLACIIDEPKRFGPKAWESQIGAEFFSSPANGNLFRILVERIRNQQPVDPSSIREDIRRTKPEGLTTSALLQILNHEKSLDGWDGYIFAIRDAHSRRLLIEASKSAYERNGSDALNLIRKASEAASAVISGQSAVMDAKTASQAFLEALQERYSSGTQPGIPTGIEVIDAHTGGMRKGELWVVGAKTSGGKSILMLQMAISAIQSGKRVAIFTLELGVEEVIGRLISAMSFVPISEIMNPRTIKSNTMDKIETKAKELAKTGLVVCDQADMTIDAITGHCIRIKETTGIDLVLIDYLQMVSSPKIKGQNREQEVAHISRACKQLAKRLKCPVITATQLNEANQARESRAIEHDADNVLFIEHAKEGVELHFWKCRNGKRGDSYRAEMDGLHQRFRFF